MHRQWLTHARLAFAQSSQPGHWEGARHKLFSRQPSFRAAWRHLKRLNVRCLAGWLVRCWFIGWLVRLQWPTAFVSCFGWRIWLRIGYLEKFDDQFIFFDLLCFTSMNWLASWSFGCLGMFCDLPLPPLSLRVVERPAMGPTQLLVQWVQGLLPGGKAAGAWRRLPTSSWLKKE